MATTETRQPPTPLGLVEAAAGYFRDKGLDSPRLDAEVLLAHVLGTERLGLYLQFDKPLQPAEVDRYRDLVRRRARGEPSAYLVGRREFWSLAFEVGPGVLIPRPDTERLVEASLETMGETGTLAELGVGSGAVVVALLAEKPGWSAWAVDIEPAPLAAAEKNAGIHGVADRLTLLAGDLFEPLAGRRFDLIVSNPPYVETAAIEGLAPDVARYEPRRALDGGADGLDALRRILARAGEHLLPGGALAVEFGAGQEGAVERLAREAGFDTVEILADYAGKPRVLRAR